jgi:hypothetical protein
LTEDQKLTRKGNKTKYRQINNLTVKWEGKRFVVRSPSKKFLNEFVLKSEAYAWMEKNRDFMKKRKQT